jgi:biopolymer transport protein ExbD
MRRRRKRTHGLDVELPITPMLDMAFQLLTFFVFTYRPSSFEGLMQLALPAAGAAQAAPGAPVDPTTSDIDPSIPGLTVVIKSSDKKDAAPAGYEVVDEATQKKSPDLKTIAELESYLGSVRKGLQNTDEIKIKADGRLKYEYIVQVMDVCTDPAKGGFKRVGFTLGEPKARP